MYLITCVISGFLGFCLSPFIKYLWSSEPIHYQNPTVMFYSDYYNVLFFYSMHINYIYVCEQKICTYMPMINARLYMINNIVILNLLFSTDCFIGFPMVIIDIGTGNDTEYIKLYTITAIIHICNNKQKVHSCQRASRNIFIQACRFYYLSKVININY